MTCNTSWWTCVDEVIDNQSPYAWLGCCSMERWNIWALGTERAWCCSFLVFNAPLQISLEASGLLIACNTAVILCWRIVRWNAHSRVSWHLKNSDYLITAYFVALYFDMTLTYYKYLITWMLSRTAGQVPNYKLRCPRRLLFKPATRNMRPFYRYSAACDLNSGTRNRRCETGRIIVLSVFIKVYIIINSSVNK